MSKVFGEDSLRKMLPANPVHLVWMAVINSEIITLLICAVLSYVMMGKVVTEILLIGAVSSLIVSLIVSWVVVVLVQKIKMKDDRQSELVAEIKKRRTAEKSLGESEKKYKDIINLLPQSFFEADTKGNITFMNQYFCENFQYTHEDFDEGLNFFDLIVGVNQKNVIREKISDMSKGGKFIDNELMIARKNGVMTPVNIYFCHVYQDDDVTGIRGIIIDITDQKKREEDLVRIEKLESIGLLTGGLAHKFNNHLSIIQGNISLALLKLKDNPYISKFLYTAEGASQRAYELARQLHSYSNEGPHILKLTDLSKIIRESVSFTYHGSNIIDDNKVPENLWPVYIDQKQLLTVFNNLFVNAAQAMPQGGTVTINAKNVILDAENGMQLKPGKYVHIAIRDNGIGIPQTHFKKIFDPFFTTKQKGSGLGLSTCFSIINRHKGYVTVESKLGLGTVFHIYLHASDEKLNNQDEVVKEGFFIIGRKVLVLDDQEEIRELSYNMLKEIGCEVSVAKNGYEVIEMYQDAMNHEKPFDIVILDLVIPGGMGGEETFRVLQAMDSNVNAIISSGCSHDPVLVDYKHYGFSGVIQKPYNIQKLSLVLFNVLRKKSLDQYDFVNLSHGFVSDFKNSKVV